MPSIIDQSQEYGQQSLSVDQQFQQYARCAANIFEFAKYVKIRDDTTQRIVPFLMWPHLRLLLMCVLVYKLLVILKGKQEGCSWTAALLHLWLCYKGATRVLCLSKGEDDASELLGKSIFINNNLPEWLKLKTGNEGFRKVTFPDTSSEILALPSTEDAGAGYTATHVTSDELDMHKYAMENFGNISPTIDAGGSHLAMSTSKRVLPTSHFKKLYRDAKAGKNGYKWLFFPWWYRPGRDMKWYRETEKKYYPRYLFEQAYPSNEAEALSAVEGLGLFDKLSLENLLDICRPAPRQPATGVFQYHPYRPECTYYAGGDAAEGRGGDYSTLWLEGTDGLKRWLAAVIHTNMLTPDLFALQCCETLKNYGFPNLVMGADAWGQQVLKNMLDAGYQNIYNTKIETGKLGYIENEANKQTTLQEFAYAVRDGLICEYEPAIQEMFGWNIDKGKYISVLPHDDLVIAGAKANIARKFAGDKSEVDVDSYA